MRHTLAMALTALSAPALAEDLTCGLTAFCETPVGCETTDRPLAARFRIAGDGGTGTLVIGEGTAEAARFDLVRIETGQGPRSFHATGTDGLLGFFTIYVNGDLAGSSHEQIQGKLRVSAVAGHCGKAGG
jgi:hypothetical protein